MTLNELELEQTKDDCATREENWLVESHCPTADRLPMGCWKVKNWTTIYRDPSLFAKRHAVAVVRGEGTNGHREMAAALYCAGFSVSEFEVNKFF